MATELPDALLHRYLLATASEDEARAIEEAYSADPELFDRLMDLDDTLLDRYLDGMLPADERADYERSFGVFPRRQERVRLLRDVAAAATSRRPASGADAFAVSATAATAAQRADRGRRPARAWSWAWGVAVAAVLVLAAVSTRQSASLQRRLDESAAAQASLQRDLAEAREQARRLRDGAQANAAQAGGPVAPGDDRARVVALALAPGLLRDGQPPLTTIPPDALLVRAALALPVTAAVSYRAVLTTAAGAERWSQDGIVPADRGGQRILMLDLPVTALPAGRVVISVSGRTAGGAAVGVEEFHFRVEKR